MTRDEFWRLIDNIDRDALAKGNDDAAVAPLERKLMSFAVPELESFEEHLSQCLYALEAKRLRANLASREALPMPFFTPAALLSHGAENATTRRSVTQN